MSILTRYRPNFCPDCGAKIIRLRWRPWSSHRFCNKCVPQFRKNWLQPVMVVLGLVGFGILIGRSLRPPPPPLLLQRIAESPVANTVNTAAAQPAMIEDDVYICGARTKKGTPCSRRVHGPVRCWQHKGNPAMLPIEKLRVQDVR
ncbi:MAG TPA: hypothetical protein VJ372_08920 [Pyrinomonadaceae bacterium]|nr:hypothetical protein [Pyrinomonadaceae bacterium]